jgi:hypothetical protein
LRWRTARSSSRATRSTSSVYPRWRLSPTSATDLSSLRSARRLDPASPPASMTCYGERARKG